MASRAASASGSQQAPVDALLEADGWAAPDPEHLPTGGELIRDYLAPLSAHPRIAPRIRYGTSVLAIARQGFDKVRTTGREQAPFLLRLSDGTELTARAVVDASGTWRSPNPLGGNGLTAHGEHDVRSAGRIFDGMPDVLGQLRAHFAGKSVAVVGSGHSATGTLLSLAELAEQQLGTEVHWATRGAWPPASRAACCRCRWCGPARRRPAEAVAAADPLRRYSFPSPATREYTEAISLLRRRPPRLAAKPRMARRRIARG